jgi:hypothetical protein
MKLNVIFKHTFAVILHTGDDDARHVTDTRGTVLNEWKQSRTGKVKSISNRIPEGGVHQKYKDHLLQYLDTY